MTYPLLRPLLIFEFLVAIEAVFTFWSQVGGQYHLDLMYWPWKFGLSIVAALLITAITAAFVKSGGAATRRIWALGTLLVATMAIAGLVTYYYHLHEPSDEDDTGDQTTITRMFYREGHRRKPTEAEGRRELLRQPRCPGTEQRGCRRVSIHSEGFHPVPWPERPYLTRT